MGFANHGVKNAMAHIDRRITRETTEERYYTIGRRRSYTIRIPIAAT
jgi:hypothetical protein